MSRARRPRPPRYRHVMARKSPAGRSAPALPPPRGLAPPGRGAPSPGRGAPSPGRGGPPGGAPGPPGRPPDAVPPEVILPPTEKDIQRKQLRDIMDRKVIVWDHMMDTEKEDDRRRGLDAFKRLSEDEMMLATRNLSKSKLKEFIDLKIHYFDQLANAKNDEKRVEGLRRFKRVGDDEFQLAKMVGPADKLEDIVKVRDEKDTVESHQEEQKKRYEKLRKQQQIPNVTVNMTDPNMTSQMLAKHQLMHVADLEKAATENVAQIVHGVPMQPQQEMIAQQQQQLLAQAMMPPPMPPMPPVPPVPPLMPPPAGYYPPMQQEAMMAMMAGQPAFGQYQQPLMMPNTQAAAVDIENKLRLLSQLETTRQALQSQRVGSRSSMAEEIKENLRKLNNLKMKLIDEILGDKPAALDGFPGFRHERMSRGPAGGDKSTRDRKIIVEFVGPGHEADATIMKADAGEKKQKAERRFSGSSVSQSFIDTVPTPACPAHTCPAYRRYNEYDYAGYGATSVPSGQLYGFPQTAYSQPQMPYTQQQVVYDQQAYASSPLPPSPAELPSPEVIWERPETKTYADKSTLIDPPEALKYIEAGVTSDTQEVVKEVYKRYTSEEPYEPPPAPPPSPLSPSPMAGVAPPGYQFLQPNYVPVVPLAMFEQGFPYMEPRARPQHEIGISATPLEDDSEATSIAPKPKSKIISKTTIVVNRGGDETGAQPVSIPLALPLPQTVKTVVCPALTAAPITPEPLAPQAPQAAPAAQDDGRKALHASMERLAQSLDEMFDSLTSPTRTRSRTRRRSRTKSSVDDEGDYYDDYEDSRTTGRYGMGRYRRRSPRRSRRPKTAYRSSWEDDEEDEGEDIDDREDTTYRSRGRRSGDSRSRARSKTRSDQDELPSLWGWLCRSLCNLTDIPDDRRTRTDPRDVRVLQMGTRIRTLIQNVIRASREVIEARRAIQQSGLSSENYVNNIFAAESKLWELIDLEAQLANELAWYRQSDFATDDQYFQGLAQAEDKIRRLIGVETQLAREIGNWRKRSTKNMPAQSRSTIYTTLSRLPSLPSMPTMPSLPSVKFPGFGRTAPPPASTTSTPSPSTTTPGTPPTPTSSSSTSETQSATTAASAVPTSTAPGTPSGSTSTTTTEGSKKKKPKKKKKSKGSSKKKKKKKKSKSGSKKKKKSKKKKSKKSSKSSKKKRRSRRSKSSKGKKKKKKRRKKKKK